MRRDTQQFTLAEHTAETQMTGRTCSGQQIAQCQEMSHYRFNWHHLFVTARVIKQVVPR